MPQKGERRKAPDGTLIEWDGSGWLPAQLDAPPPPRDEDYSKYGPMALMLREQAEGGAPEFKSGQFLSSLGGTVGAMLGLPGGPPGAIGGAALGGMAGEAARRNLDLLRGKRVPTASEVAKGIATEGALQGGAQAIGGAIGWAAPRAATRLMQSALKVGEPLLREYRTTAPKLAETLLREGVNVTRGGLQKLEQLLTATNDEIASLIQNAPGAIPKKAVAARALPVANRVAQQTNPTRDLAKVGDTVEEFLDHPIYKGDLTIPEAQAMKQGTYRQIGKKYGEIGAAEIETQKALARGLKEDVAAAVPEVNALNARDSELMGAIDAVGHRVAISGNRDPVGFAWAASQNPKAFIAALIDRSPIVKSMLARGLWTSAAKATGVEPQVIAGAVRALVSDPEDEK